MPPRLPIPGQDTNTWGDILNNYLLVAHVADGSLRAGSVGTTSLQDNAITTPKLADNSVTTLKVANSSITESKLHPDVITQLQSVGITPSDQAKLDGIAPSATANASDAQLRDRTTHTGTQPITTITNLQTELNAKASTADLTNGLAAKANSADLGSAAMAETSDFAPAGSYLLEKNNIVTLTDSTAENLLRVNIDNDGSPTAGWPDRLAFYFAGTRSGYFNEYGEIRARPARHNTVAMRAMGWGGAPVSTADIFQVANSNSSVLYFGVGPSTITVGRPINSDSNIATTGTVAASNIGNKVTASDTPPPSPAVGDIWVDTSA